MPPTTWRRLPSAWWTPSRPEVRERESTAEWSGWDGSGHELLTLGYESGGWTADGVVREVDDQGLVLDHPGRFRRLR